jgi:hypothetical protein
MDYRDGVTNEMIKVEELILLEETSSCRRQRDSLTTMEVCSKYIDDKGTSITQLQKSV